MLHLDNDTIILMNDGKLSREELEELFAIKALTINPGLCKNVMVLEKLALALSGSIPDMESVQEPDYDEIVIALYKLLKHDIIKKDSDLGEQALRYVAHICVKDGIAVLPEWLGSVQPYLDQLLPDHCKELFEGKTHEWLSLNKPFDDSDPISMHCLRTQTVNHLLSKV